MDTDHPRFEPTPAAGATLNEPIEFDECGADIFPSRVESVRVG